MRLRPSRMPCHSTETCRRMLILSVIGSLLLLAGCGASAAGSASVTNPSGTAASHPPSSPTCSAVRTAIPTPIASPPTVPPGAHLWYEHLPLGPLPLQLVYHPGAALHIAWCALPDPSQVSTQPVPETLAAGFIGPFATHAAATADQLPPSSAPPHDFPPPGPVVASTLPIHTTTWSSTDESVPLTLPATLAPGYYVFFAQDDTSVQACMALPHSGACPGNGGVSHIVQIVPA